MEVEGKHQRNCGAGRPRTGPIAGDETLWTGRLWESVGLIPAMQANRTPLRWAAAASRAAPATARPEGPQRRQPMKLARARRKTRGAQLQCSSNHVPASVVVNLAQQLPEPRGVSDRCVAAGHGRLDNAGPSKTKIPLRTQHSCGFWDAPRSHETKKWTGVTHTVAGKSHEYSLSATGASRVTRKVTRSSARLDPALAPQRPPNAGASCASLPISPRS